MSEAAAPSGIDASAAVTRMLSDERLVRRAAGGDERAVAGIFDRYHQALYRYCLAIVGNSQDAQDALQNTMVKVLRALPGEKRRIELKPWLYRIAYNESIELLRRRRDMRQLDPEMAAAGVGLAEEVSSRERLRQLIADLAELPERQRGALVMRELTGLEFTEIGAALGTSAAVARQTVYEARLGLRRMDEGREMNCEAVTKELSDGDGRVIRRRDIRAHLRTCASCRRFGEEIEDRERDLAALSPLPAVAAAGLLKGLLGGHGGAGGLVGALGGGATKSLGASAALKGAAAVAVVAAIGVGAADRGGLIDAGLPSGGASSAGSKTTPSPAVASPAGARRSQARSGVTGVRLRAEEKRQGAVRLDDSRRVRRDPQAPANPADSGGRADAVPAPTSAVAGVAHPHGKGHEKRHPDASAHGEQTAAEHKPAHHGSAGAQGHPAHPPKPPHPVHPSNPSAAKVPPPAPPSAIAPEADTQGNGAALGAKGESASTGSETGKKP